MPIVKKKTIEDYILLMPNLKDNKMKFRTGAEIVEHLKDKNNPLTPSNIKPLIDNTLPWLEIISPRVIESALEILLTIASRLKSKFRPYSLSVIPKIIERLSEGKEYVRDKCKLFLRKLVKNGIVSPYYMMDRLIPALKTPKTNIREEAMKMLITIMGSLGVEEKLNLTPFIPPLLNLMNELNPVIRKLAFETLTEMYRHTGTENEKFKNDIKESFKGHQKKLDKLFQLFDEASPFKGNEGSLGSVSTESCSHKLSGKLVESSSPDPTSTLQKQASQHSHKTTQPSQHILKVLEAPQATLKSKQASQATLKSKQAPQATLKSKQVSQATIKSEQPSHISLANLENMTGMSRALTKINTYTDMERKVLKHTEDLRRVKESLGIVIRRLIVLLERQRERERTQEFYEYELLENDDDEWTTISTSSEEHYQGLLKRDEISVKTKLKESTNISEEWETLDSNETSVMSMIYKKEIPAILGDDDLNAMATLKSTKKNTNISKEREKCETLDSNETTVMSMISEEEIPEILGGGDVQAMTTLKHTKKCTNIAEGRKEWETLDSNETSVMSMISEEEIPEILGGDDVHAMAALKHTQKDTDISDGREVCETLDSYETSVMSMISEEEILKGDDVLAMTALKPSKEGTNISDGREECETLDSNETSVTSISVEEIPRYIGVGYLNIRAMYKIKHTEVSKNISEGREECETLDSYGTSEMSMISEEEIPVILGGDDVHEMAVLKYTKKCTNISERREECETLDSNETSVMSMISEEEIPGILGADDVHAMTTLKRTKKCTNISERREECETLDSNETSVMSMISEEETPEILSVGYVHPMTTLERTKEGTNISEESEEWESLYSDETSVTSMISEEEIPEILGGDVHAMTALKRTQNDTNIFERRKECETLDPNEISVMTRFDEKIPGILKTEHICAMTMLGHTQEYTMFEGRKECKTLDPNKKSVMTGSAKEISGIIEGDKIRKMTPTELLEKERGKKSTKNISEVEEKGVIVDHDEVIIMGTEEEMPGMPEGDPIIVMGEQQKTYQGNMKNKKDKKEDIQYN